MKMAKGKSGKQQNKKRQKKRRKKKKKKKRREMNIMMNEDGYLLDNGILC